MSLTRTRIVIAVAMLAALGALTLLDRATRQCMDEGGHFVASRWTCRPLPAIHLERDLLRS